MSVICPNCGAENRERARYCSRCAGAIPWTASPTDGASADARPGGAPGAQKKKRRSSRRPDETAANPAFTRPAGVPRWALVAAAIAVVGLVAVFWAVLPKGNQPQDAAKNSAPLITPTVVPVQSATPDPDPAASGEATAATTPAALAEQTEAANQKLQQSLQQLQAEDALKSAERKEQHQKALEERKRRQQQQAEAASRRAEEAAAAQTANATAAPATPVAGQVPTTSATPASVALPAKPGVEQACAGAGNIFSRDFCRIRECGKAENANDPICVQYKEMNRQRRTGNF